MKLVHVITIFFAAVALPGPAWAAEYTATWDRYIYSSELTLVGFKLWRGADEPYTFVAEFPGWARGGRWTQEQPLSPGDTFSLTALFSGPFGTWVDAVCSDTQYADQATCEAAAETWTEASCSAGGYATEAECEGNESPHSVAYVYPMGDGSAGVRHARFKTVAGVAAAPLTKQNGARLR